jgi:hypothetical protein
MAILAFALSSFWGCYNQEAWESGRKHSSELQLEAIGKALLEYERTHGHLPPQAISAENGTPLLSWRVALLPFLKDQKLYEEFYLDEPWDSAHNKKLIGRMPEVYFSKFRGSTVEESVIPPDGKTCYLALLRQEKAFPSGSAQESRHAFVIEVDPKQAVVWTKPNDFDFSDWKGTGRTPAPRDGKFLILQCDGSVDAIADDLSDEEFASMFGVDDQPSDQTGSGE